MDVVGEIGVDGLGREGDARRPFADEGVDVGEAVVAAGGEVGDELFGGEAGELDGFGADGPDGGDPGKAGVLAP